MSAYEHWRQEESWLRRDKEVLFLVEEDVLKAEVRHEHFLLCALLVFAKFASGRVILDGACHVHWYCPLWYKLLVLLLQFELIILCIADREVTLFIYDVVSVIVKDGIRNHIGGKDQGISIGIATILFDRCRSRDDTSSIGRFSFIVYISQS